MSSHVEFQSFDKFGSHLLDRNLLLQDDDYADLYYQAQKPASKLSLVSSNEDFLSQIVILEKNNFLSVSMSVYFKKNSSMGIDVKGEGNNLHAIINFKGSL